MMERQRNILLYMPDGGEAGMIQVWFEKERSWVEARGRPYSVWEEGEDTPFSRLHDGMPGWHTCVLHTNCVLAILPRHEDYEFVRSFAEGLEDE